MSGESNRAIHAIVAGTLTLLFIGVFLAWSANINCSDESCSAVESTVEAIVLNYRVNEIQTIVVGVLIGATLFLTYAVDSQQKQITELEEKIISKRISNRSEINRDTFTILPSVSKRVSASLVNGGYQSLTDVSGTTVDELTKVEKITSSDQASQIKTEAQNAAALEDIGIDYLGEFEDITDETVTALRDAGYTNAFSVLAAGSEEIYSTTEVSHEQAHELQIVLNRLVERPADDIGGELQETSTKKMSRMDDIDEGSVSVLHDAGYTSISDVAHADLETLRDIEGLSYAEASYMHDVAQKLLEGDIELRAEIVK